MAIDGLETKADLERFILATLAKRPGRKLAAGHVHTADLEDDAVTAAKIGPGAILPDNQAVCAIGTTIDGNNAEGTANTFSRSDHGHALPGWGPRAVGDRFATAIAGSTVTAFDYAIVEMFVWNRQTISGVRCRTSTAGGVAGSMRAGIFDSAGNMLERSTANTAQGAAPQMLAVNFANTVVVDPGTYFAFLVWNNTLALAKAEHFVRSDVAANGGVITVPTTVTVPVVQRVDCPVVNFF
jgi:hypothetical protein